MSGAKTAVETNTRQHQLNEVHEQNPPRIVDVVGLHGDLRASIAPYDPRETDVSLVTDGCCPGPSAEHWFGVDQLGRDEFSRVVYGARFSLLIGVVAVSVGVSIGLLLGSMSGFFGGKTDRVIMRLMDIMLSIPGLLMAIGIAAMLGTGLFSIMIAIGVINVPIFARLLADQCWGRRATISSWRRGRSGCRGGRFSSRTSFRTRSRRSSSRRLSRWPPRSSMLPDSASSDSGHRIRRRPSGARC